MTKREISTKVAWAMLNRPYRWGGDDPLAGWDCSGLCIEILRAVGIFPRQGDATAASLEKMYPVVPTPHEGCLAFWAGSDGHINHVAYMLDGEHCIEAGGGGSTTTTEDAAIEQNAYVRVRTVASRPRLVGYCDPFSV